MIGQDSVARPDAQARTSPQSVNRLGTMEKARQTRGAHASCAKIKGLKTDGNAADR